jgi:hypothetical protein
MFKLRKEHLAAFEAQVANLFVTRVQAHVKAVWPAECAELGDPGVASTVQSLVQRAAAAGLTSESDMVRFVDLGFLLALDFDTNPAAAWTRPILTDRTLAPSARIERLYQRMEQEFAVMEKRRAGKV